MNEYDYDKLNLKPGFGEFYGGNQIHITRANNKQKEKMKYKPFEGKGNKICKDTKYKQDKYKINYNSVIHKTNIFNQKEIKETKIIECDINNKQNEKIIDKNKKDENNLWVFLIIVLFLYICYLLICHYYI